MSTRDMFMIAFHDANFLLPLYQEQNKKVLATNNEDSGYDLFTPPCPRDHSYATANGDWRIPPRTTVKIPLGIKVLNLGPNNYKTDSDLLYSGANKAYPYYIFPRSSISKTPMRLANSTGIIDGSYRGELIALLDNISDLPYIIKKGQRLLQICRPTLEPFKMRIMGIVWPSHMQDIVHSSERGEGGVGSTGK